MGNPNLEFMTLLLDIQRRLDDQATMMQQQAELIQNLQQQQGRIVDPEQEGPEDEEVNMDPAYEGEEHEGNGVEDPPIRAPGVLNIGLQEIRHRNPCGGSTFAKDCVR